MRAPHQEKCSRYAIIFLLDGRGKEECYLRRRKRSTMTARLQWSHVLTNVETAFALALPLESAHRGFNGATSSRTWKLNQVQPPQAPRPPASMEPRPHERGNATRVTSSSESMGCFNGATSSRTWKPEDARRYVGPSPASMEPRPHERGNPNPSAPHAPNTSRFNGATSSRTWKLPSEGRHVALAHLRTPVAHRASSLMFRGDEDCPETRAVCVLHVEDDPTISEPVNVTLQDEGWSVETCINGAAALEKLEDRRMRAAPCGAPRRWVEARRPRRIEKRRARGGRARLAPARPR
jgi:hypothetical protein